jgi:RNA polymerase primary sigma factor
MASDLDDFLDSDPVFSRALENALSHLGEKERQVIELRYGLRDGRPRYLYEVAAEMGISTERVRKLESRALDKLRGMLRPLG